MAETYVMKPSIYTKECWYGDSKDGVVVHGDGCHIFCMSPEGLIAEAYEVYETDEGDEIVTPLPEMHQVSWIKDLGFENLDVLDAISEMEFCRLKSLTQHATMASDPYTKSAD